MITFNKPCLRWKLIGGRKGMVGWPGFIAPYHTRYRHQHGVQSITPVNEFGTVADPGPFARIYTWDTDVDKAGNITGQSIADQFPYDQPLTENPMASETWTVTDTHYQHVYNNGYNFFITDVTMSNEYTIGELDADCQALIDSIDPATVPWGQIAVNLDATALFTGDPDNNIPLPWNYAGVHNSVVPLKAAAYSAFVTGQVGPTDWFPNAGVKIIGYIAMAGNFCLKTFTLDEFQNLLDQTCDSRVGSCAAAAKITPPPLSATTNSYLTVTPNCRCGG